MGCPRSGQPMQKNDCNHSRGWFEEGQTAHTHQHSGRRPKNLPLLRFVCQRSWQTKRSKKILRGPQAPAPMRINLVRHILLEHPGQGRHVGRPTYAASHQDAKKELDAHRAAGPRNPCWEAERAYIDAHGRPFRTSPNPTGSVSGSPEACQSAKDVAPAMKQRLSYLDKYNKRCIFTSYIYGVYLKG